MKKSKFTDAQIKEALEYKKQKLLPHLFGFPWYEWAWKFFTSTNRFTFLCAGNQLSKSSTQIRKCIDWATDKSKWEQLWPGRIPTQFWYLYPSASVATVEFEEKWVVEFLPKGDMKTDPVYGWKEKYRSKQIYSIRFNSGVTVYFKSYEQDAQNLQTATVYSVFADEELPYHLLGELRSRLNATNGFFSMAFTATIGQDEWRRTIEPVNSTEELFPDAMKLQVSLYDCLKYKDGTKSFWTINRIREIEKECATEQEVLKRVHGRFILTQGLRVPSFNRSKNIVTFASVPPANWSIYTGTDIGSGGENNHPAAIILVAVRPDHRFGVVFRGWRGDGVNTASNDILQKHTELITYEIPDQSGQLNKKQFAPMIQSYDWQARDFFLVSSTAGVGFTPANKNKNFGDNLINTLFKLGMLAVSDSDPELSKLVLELSSLRSDESKSRAKDDFYDALRYAVGPIPWDFQGVAGEILKVEEVAVDERSEEQIAYEERRGKAPDSSKEFSVEDELEFWQNEIEGT